METLTIGIRNNKALKLIHDLEDLNLIKVLNHNKKESSDKLSSILAGSITSEQAKELHSELTKMRNEWE